MVLDWECGKAKLAGVVEVSGNSLEAPVTPALAVLEVSGFAVAVTGFETIYLFAFLISLSRSPSFSSLASLACSATSLTLSTICVRPSTVSQLTVTFASTSAIDYSRALRVFFSFLRLAFSCVSNFADA